MNSETTHSMDCLACREALNQQFDAADAVGDAALSETRARPAEAHLVTCSACREYADELRNIAYGLGALELLPLSGTRASDILAQTVDAQHRDTSATAGSWRNVVLGGLAIAAAVVLAVQLPRARVTEVTHDIDPLTEIAADQTQLVLALAVAAVQQVERQAVGDVLTERMPSVLGRVFQRVRNARRSAGDSASQPDVHSGSAGDSDASNTNDNTSSNQTEVKPKSSPGGY